MRWNDGHSPQHSPHVSNDGMLVQHGDDFVLSSGIKLGEQSICNGPDVFITRIACVMNRSLGKTAQCGRVERCEQDGFRGIVDEAI